MPKMMLIIDKPESCDECPCCESGYESNVCQVHHAILIHDKIPNWCPLRPMPEKYLERDITIETERDVEMCSHGISIGRNVLIDEILGETYEENDNS